MTKDNYCILRKRLNAQAWITIVLVFAVVPLVLFGGYVNQWYFLGAFSSIGFAMLSHYFWLRMKQELYK